MDPRRPWSDYARGVPAPRLAYGSKLWIGLAGYIVAVDGYAAFRKKETMSTAFWRAICHPWHRPWVVGVWAYITLHLFHGIPDRFDPLRCLLDRNYMVGRGGLEPPTSGPSGHQG